MSSISDINKKLKERRQKINLEKKHEKIKIFRRFNQDKKKEEIIPDELNKQTFENKLEKFEKIQKMIQAYDEKLGLPQDPAKIEKKSNVNKDNAIERNKSNQKIEENKTPNNESYLNKKRDRNDNQANKNPKDWNQKNGNNKGDFLKGKDKFQKDKNYVGPTKEERELEKQKKLEKRKKNFRNMNKKTQFGQPIMKFRIENLLHKIKSKIKKGDY